MKVIRGWLQILLKVLPNSRKFIPRAATVQKAVNGFSFNGISTFNYHMFNEDDYAASLATKQPPLAASLTTEQPPLEAPLATEQPPLEASLATEQPPLKASLNSSMNVSLQGLKAAVSTPMPECTS